MALEIRVINNPTRSITLDTVEVANASDGLGVIRLNGSGELVDYHLFDSSVMSLFQNNLYIGIQSFNDFIKDSPSDYIFIFATQGNDMVNWIWTDELIDIFKLFGTDEQHINSLINTPGFNWVLVGTRNEEKIIEVPNVSIPDTQAFPPAHTATGTATTAEPVIINFAGDFIQPRTGNYLSRDGRDVAEMRTMDGDLYLGTNPGSDNPYEQSADSTPTEGFERKAGVDETKDGNYRLRNIAPGESGSDAVNLQQLVDHIVDDSDTLLNSDSTVNTEPRLPPSPNKTWSQRRIREIISQVVEGVIDYIDTKIQGVANTPVPPPTVVSEGSGFGDEPACDGGVIVTTTTTPTTGTAPGTAPGTPTGVITQKSMFVSQFELTFNAETNGATLPVDLYPIIKPNITGGEKGTKVLVLNVRAQKISPVWWARWVWAFSSGVVTDEVVGGLFDQGVLKPGASTIGPTGREAWQDYWRNGFVEPSAALGLRGVSWEEFKSIYKTTDTNNPNSDNIASNWDNATLFTLLKNAGTGGVGPGDLGYWADYTESGSTLTSLSEKSGYTAARTSGTGLTNSITINSIGSLVSDNKTQYLPDSYTEQLPDPTLQQNNNTGFSWDPNTNKWTHTINDPDNSNIPGSSALSNGGKTEEAQHWVSDGIFNASTEIGWSGFSGYAKPFTLETTPMSVLFAINPDVDANGQVIPEGDLFSGQNLLDKILDPTSHGELVIKIPEQFILA
jgi:hypothetical protein